MTRLQQPDPSSSKGDDVVIWMRAKDNDPLRKRFSPLRSVRVVSVRFSTGPARDGVLQLVEHLQVDIVSRSAGGQQIAHAMLVIILIRQLEDRFLQFVAEPDHCFSNLLVIPLTSRNQPGRVDTGQLS